MKQVGRLKRCDGHINRQRTVRSLRHWNPLVQQFQGFEFVVALLIKVTGVLESIGENTKESVDGAVITKK